MRTLLIDNYDSYTYNLHQLVAATFDAAPHVLRNDDPELTCARARRFDAIVVSPGPGRPQHRRDVGRCPEVVRDSGVPVLGVCLGHQVLAHLCGADVVAAPEPRHGSLSRVRHHGRGLYAGIPDGFTVVRYHSLCVAEPLPAELRPEAWAEDGVLMGLRHRDRPWWGVQFHPESVATEHGARLLRNFRRLVVGDRRRPVTLAPSAGAGRPTGARSPAPAPPAADGPAAGPAGAARPSGERWVLRHRRLPFAVAPDRAFRRLFAGHRYAFWLDSSQPSSPTSRFSFLGAPGGPHGEVLHHRAGSGAVRVLDGHDRPVATVPGDIFEVLERRLAARALAHPPDLPFDLKGGYVGYLGYELGAAGGPPSRHRAPTQDAVWVAATRLVAVDHRDGATWVVAMCRDDPGDRSGADRWLAGAAEELRLARAAAPPPAAVDAPDPERWLVRSRDGYLDDVRTCLEELRAGESYEICLTDEARVPFAGDPLDLYLAQRRRNPAPYAAYLQLGDTRVLCSSPERFLKVSEDGTAVSGPIKGTARRHPDPATDRARREELATSAKNRAENLMIVDVVRNDLGRVCQVGTVQVPSFMAVESYATVHHLVSTVSGRLRPGIGPVGAARACFPAGSMTGAPKLRTMEIIERLEGRPRGVYAGALGYFGLTGAAELNVVIRTAVLHDGVLRVGAGGAVVLGSSPVAEYEEMVVKLAAPLPASEGHEPGRDLTVHGDGAPGVAVAGGVHGGGRSAPRTPGATPSPPVAAAPSG